MHSLLKSRWEFNVLNSWYWISSEIWYMNILKWIQKNHNSDFNIYEFTSLILWEKLWFNIKSTQQLNTINLNTRLHCFYSTELHWTKHSTGLHWTKLHVQFNVLGYICLTEWTAALCQAQVSFLQELVSSTFILP